MQKEQRQKRTNAKKNNRKCERKNGRIIKRKAERTKKECK
jgi:hypothetical protein